MNKFYLRLLLITAALVLFSSPAFGTTTITILNNDSAGAAGIFNNFANAPFANTWFSIAEANSLAGSDLNGGTQEINAQFNVNLGNPGCFDNPATHFYLGLDNSHGSDIDLVAVLLHEF